MNMILFEHVPAESKLPTSDSRAQHILNILKLRIGDSFKMGIINESEGTAVINSITEEYITFTYTPQAVPVMYPVTLMVAQVRPICMKRILREAVSLGVGKIILFSSDTGEKSYAQSNLFKTGEYKEYLLDGAMQSCHAGMSSISFAANLNEAISLAGENQTKDGSSSLIMLDNVTGAVPLSSASIESSAVLAIGPERGFSDRERNLLLKSGYLPMLLGKRVLRTETACSTGVAVLLSRMNLL